VTATRFDYAAWVERARRFVEDFARVPGAQVRSTEIAEPAASAQVAVVEQQLGRPLPHPLRELFTIGSAHVDCHYVFEPDAAVIDAVLPDGDRIFGGARLGPMSGLPEFSRSAAEWATDTWVADAPDQQATWTSALPFARMDNGDYLALDLRSRDLDPPVLYLNHDDDTSIIAPDIATFLRAWERLAYVGPEHWLLLEFTGNHGYLDPDTRRAAALRRLFDR
jgi:hypothetical protein